MDDYEWVDIILVGLFCFLRTFIATAWLIVSVPFALIFTPDN